MAAQQPAQALASHLISQTLASVALLESMNLISHDDAGVIRTKLPNPYTTFPTLAMPHDPARDLPAAMGNLAASQPLSPQIVAGGVGANPGSPSAPGAGPGGPPAYAPSHGPAHGPQPCARALWDYGGADAEDLNFRAGDIIAIDEEVNREWFRGRVVQGAAGGPVNEKGGLFPSNYVEKLRMTTEAIVPPPPQQMGMGYQAPQQPYYSPMPPQQQVAGGAVIPSPGPPDEHKKHKFGKIGGNLGNAAVTGAGFGFGSAVASNIVNAIL